MSFQKEYSDYLMHYGVKGMKWKDHKYAEIVKVGEKTRSTDYKATKEKIKNTADLQARINKTQNTVPGALKRGMILKSINKEGALALESAKKGYGNAFQGESTVKRNEVSLQDKKKGMKYDADSNKMVSATKGAGNQFQGESTVKRNEDPNAWKKNLDVSKTKEANKARAQSKVERLAAENEASNDRGDRPTVKNSKKVETWDNSANVKTFDNVKKQTIKSVENDSFIKKVKNFFMNLFK